MSNLILVLIGAIGVMIMGVPVAFAFAIAGFILCEIYGIGITGAICGVATSALAAIGGMLIPAMEKKGYPRGYSTGLAVSSSVLSLLIPPSTSMIIFGVAGRVSIPLLFVATIIPGLILTVLLCIINNIMVKQIPTIQVPPKVSHSEKRREILQTGKESIFILLMPILILVGIYGGIFTPTEAASIAVVYVCIIGFFVYKDLTFKIFWNSITKAGILTGSIVIVFFTNLRAHET